EVSFCGQATLVIDRSAAALVLPGGDVVYRAGAADARLQQPSDAARSVRVATPSGLVAQPLRGGAATVREADGVPAAPVRVGACAFGAWAGTGRVLRGGPGTDRGVDEDLAGSGGRPAVRGNRRGGLRHRGGGGILGA